MSTLSPDSPSPADPGVRDDEPREPGTDAVAGRRPGRRPLVLAALVVLLAIVVFLIARALGGDDGSAVGGVVTQGGDPAAGVTVQLLPESDDDAALPMADTDAVESTTTDASGRFEMEASPGSYSVVVDVSDESQSCRALMPFVEIDSGSTASVDFDLPGEGASGGIGGGGGDYWYMCFEAQP